MKAVVASAQGTSDVLEMQEVPTPQPTDNEVLIKVRASSVNPIDIKVRSISLPMTPSYPAILQGDVSGEVVAVGANVDTFQVGDEVFGCVGGIRGFNTEGEAADLPGALAEYVAADPRLIARKPANLDHREAAALPLVSLTAWLALKEKVDIRPGDKILIQGGTGGVGHVAVQLAKEIGAEVFTTVSGGRKAELAKGFGADHVIDYTRESVEDILATHTGGRGFDVIFDTAGGGALDNSFKLIKPMGDVVTIVGAATHNLAPLYLKGANLHTVLMLVPMMYGLGRERQHEILEEVRALAEQGVLRPLLHEARFSLEEAAAAQDAVQNKEALGKVVVEVK